MAANSTIEAHQDFAKLASILLIARLVFQSLVASENVRSQPARIAEMGRIRPYQHRRKSASCDESGQPHTMGLARTTFCQPGIFATAEEAEAHDRWFRAKVQASLDDQRPSTPHDHVMATLPEIVEAKRRARASAPVTR